MLFIFDLDDTIYDYMWPFNQTVKDVLGIEDKDTCFDLYKTMRQCSDKMFELQQEGKISVQEAGYKRVAEMAQIHNLGFDRQKCVDFHHSYLGYQNQITIKEEMHRILSTLRNQKCQLAVITNGNGNHQMNKIRHLGVMDYFEEKNIFVTGDYGFDKPDQRIFDIAINAVRGSHENTYYIGDSYSSDVVGSKRAGIRSIWLKIRDFEIDYSSGYKPDHTVTSYKQLEELINNIVGE